MFKLPEQGFLQLEVCIIGIGDCACSSKYLPLYVGVVGLNDGYILRLKTRGPTKRS